MLAELCKELNNWFVQEKVFGTFTIKDGQLVIPKAQNGQFYRICESTFNDGVYQYPTFNLMDETFDGVIWLMRVPVEVIKLSKEIDTWKEDYGEITHSPFSSEKVGEYSWTKGSGNGSFAVGSNGARWQAAFADQLSHWRKV